MDVIAILSKLESLGMIRQKKRSGNYMQVYCPFHSDGKERKPSCGVLIESEYRAGRNYPQGWWHCFACGYAHSMTDAIAELLRLHKVSQSLTEWLQEYIPELDVESNLDYDRLLPADTVQALEGAFAADYMRSLMQPHKQVYVSEEELATYRYTVPYMYERKLTDDIIDRFDVGVDMNFVPPGRKRPIPCITFPVRDIEGHTLFLCRRSIAGKMYHYPEGTEKPLYGLDMLPTHCQRVFICESIINSLTLWSWGYPSVALLGTGNSLQMHQLKMIGADEFNICTDGDEAGHRAARKLRRVLHDVAITWVVPMPDGKDVNDLTKDEFDKCFSARY